MIAVIEDRTAAQDLLNARGIFPGDADHHIDQLVEPKSLFDDGSHGDVAGVIFGVAYGDLFG